MVVLALSLALVQVKTSYVYKEAAGVAIELDVHRDAGAEPRPVLVWIHGGALIMGSRGAVPRHLLDLCQAEGFALVSIDYRLAPQVKVPDILGDVEDAFRWIRGKGVELARLDPRKLVVSGGSAGGYLTLMAGLLEPRPTALVAYWGYGDVDGAWYTTPSAFYRRAHPLFEREEVLKALAPEVVTAPAGKAQAEARSRYYYYLRQNGLWTREVAGFEPGKRLDPYCPVRNVTPAYPPSMLIHGTADDDVPYELSAAMAKELEKHKVAHELVTVQGSGHGLSGGDPKAVAAAYEKSRAFIKANLK
ncbi:MAG TPA: alpha/beta hydrolase [Planctomycetota bacterium]